MNDWLIRSKMLLGEEAIHRLKDAHVAIFGIGGVGGYVAEGLARMGIGTFTLVDHDQVADSNRNRQIIAALDTLGRYKTDVMKERIQSINKEAVVITHHCFFLPEDKTFPFHEYTYIADAVDTVSAKLELAVRAKKEDIPIISCMGTGNKLDPTKLQVGDIYETSICPLAKVMRKELRKKNISKLKVVHSTEVPLKPVMELQEEEGRRSIPGSVSFVPSVAGMIMAGEIIKDLLDNK